MYHDSPLVQTKDVNYLYEASDYYRGLATKNSPFIPISQRNGKRTIDNSLDLYVSAKKYVFNPLSEPFLPTRSINLNPSSPISLTSSSAKFPTTINAHELEIATIPLIQKKFECILCPEQFATHDELKLHIEQKVQQQHVCVICAKSYAHNYLLHRHITNHRKLKTFKCRGCSKKFRNLNQLGKHFEFCRYKLYMFI